MTVFHNDTYLSVPTSLTEASLPYRNYKILTACSLKMTLSLALNRQILFFQCSHTAELSFI